MMINNSEAGLSINQLLDLLTISKIGSCEWDMETGYFTFSREWSDLLGYEFGELDGDGPVLERLIYPEDMHVARFAIHKCRKDKGDGYEFNVRMLHKNGSWVWTHNIGRVVDRKEDGSPARIAGGCVNIDGLKIVEQNLSDTLKEIEQSKVNLESKVIERTQELAEQEKFLRHVSEIAKLLVAFDESHDFHQVINRCLHILGMATGQNRVYVWKDVEIDGVACCIQVYEWIRGAESIQGIEEFENIPYGNLPHFYHMIQAGECLNRVVSSLSQTERDILEPQGIKSLLVAPINIQGKNWGFIGVDNCFEEYHFSAIEEELLKVGGFLIASAIHKYQTQKSLREMEERTTLMLNATPLCCNLWNRDFQNMACNDEAVRLFELNSQQEYLDNFYKLSPEFQPCGLLSSELALEMIKKAFEDGYNRFEWQHQKLSGELVPTEVTLVRIKYQDDYIIAGYTRDLREWKAMLSDMKKAENNLRLAHEEALLNSKAKTNFLANMSHEIRTPMNAISGLAEIILRDSKDIDVTANAQGIKQSCSSLLNIINDILDISKIESGKLEINVGTYSTTSLINDAISICRLRLEHKPIQFVADIHNQIPARLYGDEIRIKQILINVLSNAVKFTTEGFIMFRAYSRKTETGVELVFEIEDSGQGISDKDMKNLFREFERINTKKNRNIEGTGLGLAITKRLCEMMNGEITLSSKVNVGSIFTIVIPQETIDEEILAKVDQPKTVLICESRERYLSALCREMERFGCEYVACHNQSELLDTIYQRPYDFVLTSFMHLEKVNRLLEKADFRSQVVLMANLGETTLSATGIKTIFMPVYCIPLADVFNDVQSEYGGDKKAASQRMFIAPDIKILIVDDNPVNLQVAKGLLKPYQLIMDTAINGFEAVKKVENSHYDLVFMDHMMPEMDGIDTTIAIRKKQGDYFKTLPIIALTANAIVGTKEMFLLEGMDDFLAKPIELNKLNQILNKWIPESFKQYVGEGVAQKEENTDVPTLRIDGLDTAKGIRMLGGDVDNYLHILTTYYYDGLEKLELLPGYIKAGNLENFKINVHAIKSTSASVGAQSLSTAARSLEEASASGDQEFIFRHLPAFLSDLQCILTKIKPFLPGDSQAQTEAAGKMPGEIPWLREQLLSMKEAIDIAEISRIESLLKETETFIWPQAIKEVLTAVKKATEVFDYDLALEEVEKLLGGIE